MSLQEWSIRQSLFLNGKLLDYCGENNVKEDRNNINVVISAGYLISAASYTTGRISEFVQRLPGVIRQAIAMEIRLCSNE